jgi:hypothetical protein
MAAPPDHHLPLPVQLRACRTLGMLQQDPMLGNAAPAGCKLPAHNHHSTQVKHQSKLSTPVCASEAAACLLLALLLLLPLTLPAAATLTAPPHAP